MLKMIPAFALALALTAARAPTAHAEDCTNKWEPFSSRPYEQIAFPDTYVSYWRYRFALSDPAPVALRLKGRFAHARYVSFNVYDAATGNVVAGLADARIVPDEGADNPFIPGVPRATGNRDYTVWAAAAPAPLADASTPNLIALPVTRGSDGSARFAEVWYRVYVADDPQDPIGHAPLPQIEAFDAAGAPTACPAQGDIPEPPIYNALGNLPPRASDGTVNFYRPQGGGVYANGDNLYLAARFKFLGSPMAVIKLKAPVFPDTAAGLETLSGRDDVRYWSFCLGGLDQRTSSCLSDADATVGAEGYVRLVVGPPDVGPLARARGFDFLPWGRQLSEVLIYRNLMTSDTFAGSVAKVSTYPLGGDAATYAAQKFIGDAAPQGRECTRAEFVANSCGL